MIRRLGLYFSLEILIGGMHFVAPASRRQFFRFPPAVKMPAGRRRYKNSGTKFIALFR